MREIGRGGMGCVWLARDQLLGRDVAYKELHVETDPHAVARFLREARVTARLDHPAIVPVHDAGQTADGRLFYVMRLLDGRSLHEVLGETRNLHARLGLIDALVSVCQGVAHAHRQGVIHRDLKPANVMIGHYGEVQVVDWGLARSLSSQTAAGGVEDTKAGNVVGTPLYMSPEQGSAGHLTAATDVWSLGVMLFEILTDTLPFNGADAWAILRQSATAPAPDALALAPLAPPELAAIAQRALTRDLAVRYPDAGALLADLESWRTGARVSAYRYSAWEEVKRLLDRYRVVLVGIAAATLAASAVGLVAVGEVLAERDRARAAEISAREAESVAVESREQVSRLAQASLVSGALGSTEDPIAALTLAAEALRLGAEPTARGVVARLFDSPQWQFERALPAGPAPCFALTAHEGKFACAGPKASWLSDAETGLRWRDPRPANGLAIAPDGAFVEITRPDSTVSLLRADTGATVWELATSAESFISPAFSPDGRWLAWGAGADVIIADAQTGVTRAKRHCGSRVGGVHWIDAGPRLELFRVDGVVLRMDLDAGSLESIPAPPGQRGTFSAAFVAAGTRLIGTSLTGETTLRTLGEPAGLRLRASGPTGRVGVSGDGAAVWQVDEEGFRAWTLPDGGLIGRMPGLPYRTVMWMDGADSVYIPAGNALAVYRRHDARVSEWRPEAPIHLCSTLPGDRLDCLVGAGELVRTQAGTDRREVLRTGISHPFRQMQTDERGGYVISDGSRLRRLVELAAYYGQNLEFVADAGRHRMLYTMGTGFSAVQWPDAPGAWTDIGAPIDAAAVTPDGWLLLTRDRYVQLDAAGSPVKAPSIPIGDHLAVEPVTGRLAVWYGEHLSFFDATGAPVGPGWAWSPNQYRRPSRLGSFLSPDRFAVVDGADVVVVDIPTGTEFARLVAHSRPIGLHPLLGEDGRPDGQLATLGFDGRLVFWNLLAAEGPGPELADRVVGSTGYRLEGGRVTPR